MTTTTKTRMTTTETTAVRRDFVDEARKMAKHLMLIVTFTSLLTTVLTLTTPPTITRQPRKYDITYDSRENIHLECEADSDPPSEYSWTKDGVEIDFPANPRYSMEAGTGNFDIINPDEGDQGYFQCRATNSHGVALTNVIHLREAFIDQMPKVTQAEVRTVGLGHHVTLKCTPPAALPKPDIFWTSGGGDESEFEAVHLTKRVTIDHDGNLHIINVEDIDDNDGIAYSCNVFNPVLKSIQQGYDQIVEINDGDVSSDYTPELLWSSPINTVAMKGTKLKLKCIFAGKPTPEVTWKKIVGNELPRKRTRYTSANQELQIRRVDFSDQGQYECTGTNAEGSESKVITVTIQSKPFFITEPEDKNGNEEEDEEIKCEADGNPTPDVRLYRNGVPIEDEDLDPERYILSPGKIVIKGLLKDVDTAVFQCNASNVNGYAFADAYLNVLAEPPMFTQKPEPILRVTEGQDATLICRTFGAPKPKITWGRKGKELVGEKYDRKENGDLVIKSVRIGVDPETNEKYDEGVYNCVAHNKFGDITSQGELRVFARTRITMAPESATERAGSGAGFKCKAEGDANLPISIEWRKDGALLVEDGRIKIMASKNVLQHAESSVVISDVSDADSGAYKCVAKTELDNAEAEADLVIQDVPQAPEKPSIVHCHAREVLLEWNPGSDGRSPILNYIIQSNNSYDPEDWKNVDTDIEAESKQREVELSPWANYTFRVYARNKLGVSAASPVSAVCTTPPDTPDRNPAKVKGEGKSPNDMVISWEPMPKMEHNGPDFHYIVKYRRQDVDPTPDWVEAKINNPMESELTVPNQMTYVPFDIMVIAYNGLGQSKEMATMVTGWSGEARPTKAPQNFRCEEPSTPTTTKCSWDRVPRDSIQGLPAGYRIQFWVKEKGESTMEEQDYDFENNQGSVTLLKPYSNMVLQIRVRNSLYTSDASEQVEVTTPEGRPGQVKKLRAIPQGQDQFKITWSPPTEPNGELHGYRLYYREVNGLTLGESVQYQGSISPTATSLRLTDLKQETTYRISVKAYTSVGEGDAFFVEETTTVSTPPDPAVFKIHQVSDKMINVTVKPANSENPGSDFYVEFKHADDDAEWRKVRVDDPESTPFVELKGLESGTQYLVRVVASNGPQSMKNSPEQLIVTSGEGPDTKFAYATWFIVLMCIIIILIIILIIVCLIKRSRGGRYPVQKKEQEAGYDAERDGEAGLGDFTRTEDDQDLLHRSGGGSQGSLNGSLKPLESDADSLAAYGDGEGGKFNEDGSFIGQYGPDKKRSNTGTDVDLGERINGNVQIISNNNGAVTTFV